MSGNEPVMLYASAAARYSLLSWQPESSTDSVFLAIPRVNGRKKDPSVPDKRRDEALARIEAQMERTGGAWTRVRRAQDQYLVASKFWPVTGYRPPEKMMVVGWGGAVREHRFESDLVLDQGEFALLPVDADSQAQLERWLEGLQGMPSEVRASTLRGVANEGVLDSVRAREADAALADSQKSAGAPWLWIVLAAVALVAGAVGGYYGRSMQEPKAQPAKQTVAAANKSPEAPKTPPSLAAPLAGLEQRMTASKDSNIHGLVVNHVSPFSNEPDASVAKRTGEAWMVLKLVLLKNGHKIDPRWSDESNQSASAIFFNEKDSLPAAERDAIVAVACYAGSPPAGGIAQPGECSHIDWQQAQQTLTEMEQPAAAKTQPVTPQKPNTAPDQPNTTPHQRDAAPPAGRGGDQNPGVPKRTGAGHSTTKHTESQGNKSTGEEKH